VGGNFESSKCEQKKNKLEPPETHDRKVDVEFRLIIFTCFQQYVTKKEGKVVMITNEVKRRRRRRERQTGNCVWRWNLSAKAGRGLGQEIYSLSAPSWALVGFAVAPQ
jgi:hypothetical protein